MLEGAEVIYLEKALSTGRDPLELILDVMCEDEGQGLLMYPHCNFSGGNMSGLEEMLADPTTVLGLSDAGAHLETICDASLQTYMLSHWVRDRPRSIPLETMVWRMTQHTASLLGMHDPGCARPWHAGRYQCHRFDHINLCPREH